MGRLLNPHYGGGPKPAQVNHPAVQAPRSAPVDARSGPRPGPLPARHPAPPPEKQNPSRNLAFRAGLGFTFIRVSYISELIASTLHANTYLLYLVGPPALLGTLFTGGIARTLRHPAAKLWLAFSLWVALSLPFSSWLGGSMADFKSYVLYSLPMLFTVGGLTLTWKEVRATFTTIGVAGMVIIAAASLLATDDNGRTDLNNASGSIGNSNDLASHFIFVLPFVLYIAMDSRRAKLIRFASIGFMAYAMKVILGTASRGAVIAIAVGFLFVLLKASGKQRVAALAIVGVFAAATPLLLHGNAADRLASLVGASQHEEAKESGEARQYLLKQSIIYTLQHPIFGVGLGQFSNFEGKLSTAEGKVGNWHETHNSFTQVSSECGLPGVIFFAGAIFSAMFSVYRVFRRAQKARQTEIANTCFCYLLSMICFVTSITFLANAFRFYLSLMIGLAIALSAAAQEALSAEPANAAAATLPWPGRVPAPRLVPS